MLTKPRLGTRRWIGSWPPSNPGATVLRFLVPLEPRPAVSPRPEPGPRPTRFLDLRAPAGGLSVCSEVPIFTISSRSTDVVGRLHGDEVRDLADHPANGGCVLEHRTLVETAQSEAADRVLLFLRTIDRAANERDLELERHLRPPSAGRPSCRADGRPARGCAEP